MSLTEPLHSYKVSNVLGFDPWQHPTMGTNLREPVPADPELTPKFTPIDQATPAQRAAQSAELIKEAGMSARKIGVPLTLQDFPDHPSMNSNRKKENPMHASIPLFGLRAPRWRAKQGLDDRAIPGTVAYEGVTQPVGGTGLRLYNDRSKELRVLPLRKLTWQRVNPLGIGAASFSSSPGAGAGNLPAMRGVPAGATPSNTRTPVTKTAAPTVESSSTSFSTATEHPKRTTTLKRGRRTAKLEDTDNTSAAADDMITDNNNNNQDQEEAEPAPKRRKRSAAASRSHTHSESTTTLISGNQEDANRGQGQGQTRRSTRVTRAAAANAAVPQSRSAPRGRATKGKKVNKRS